MTPVKYLDPAFSVGGYTADYATGWARIFGQGAEATRSTKASRGIEDTHVPGAVTPLEPLNPAARLAAVEDRDGNEATLGTTEEGVGQAQAQGEVLPLPPAQEAGTSPPASKRHAGRPIGNRGAA